MKTIGIDLGTTSLSLALLDGDTPLKTLTLPGARFLPGEPWAREQDVNDVLPRAKQALDELLSFCPDVQRIGLTGQMHGVVYLDTDGHPVSPLYTWQDGRGDLKEENGLSTAERLHKETGLPAASGYGLVTHTWNRTHGLVPKGAVSLCTLPDALGMLLTGRSRPLIHASMAASLGLYDLQSAGFRLPDGMDRSILPDVTKEPALIGTYRGIPVSAALGDNQASFLGTVGLEEGTLLVNVGTGSQICALSDRILTAPGIECRPYLNGRWLIVGAPLCGGRAYAILERFFRTYAEALGCSGSQYTVMSKLIEGMTASSLTVDTTFSGTRLDPDARGSIQGLSEDSITPADLILGTLEGIARELYDLFAPLGLSFDRLVGSGNGLRLNAALVRCFERRFGAPLTLSIRPEEAACGAAHFAALAEDER